MSEPLDLEPIKARRGGIAFGERRVLSREYCADVGALIREVERLRSCCNHDAGCVNHRHIYTGTASSEQATCRCGAKLVVS